MRKRSMRSVDSMDDNILEDLRTSVGKIRTFDRIVGRHVANPFPAAADEGGCLFVVLPEYP